MSRVITRQVLLPRDINCDCGRKACPVMPAAMDGRGGDGGEHVELRSW